MRSRRGKSCVAGTGSMAEASLRSGFVTRVGSSHEKFNSRVGRNFEDVRKIGQVGLSPPPQVEAKRERRLCHF